MKASFGHSLISFSVLSTLSSAWPLIRSPIDLVERAPQSYSVVAVDGGSTATAPASPTTKTVTDAVTQIQTSVLLSTIVASPSDSPPATTIVPQTVTFATTIIQTSELSASTPAPVTVTVSPTLSAYDNGQWHTTYYFKSTTTPAANGDANEVAVTSAASPAPTATASIDPAQWSAWSGQNSGQYSTQ